MLEDILSLFLTIKNVQLPRPLAIRPGASLRFKATFVAARDLPPASSLKVVVKIQRHALWRYWTLPCLKGIGSW